MVVNVGHSWSHKQVLNARLRCGSSDCPTWVKAKTSAPTSLTAATVHLSVSRRAALTPYGDRWHSAPGGDAVAGRSVRQTLPDRSSRPSLGVPRVGDRWGSTVSHQRYSLR
jgi:hypothetical protein